MYKNFFIVIIFIWSSSLVHSAEVALPEKPSEKIPTTEQDIERDQKIAEENAKKAKEIRKKYDDELKKALDERRNLGIQLDQETDNVKKEIISKQIKEVAKTTREINAKKNMAAQSEREWNQRETLLAQQLADLKGTLKEAYQEPIKQPAQDGGIEKKQEPSWIQKLVTQVQIAFKNMQVWWYEGNQEKLKKIYTDMAQLYEDVANYSEHARILKKFSEFPQYVGEHVKQQIETLKSYEKAAKDGTLTDQEKAKIKNETSDFIGYLLSLREQWGIELMTSQDPKEHEDYQKIANEIQSIITNLNFGDKWGDVIKKTPTVPDIRSLILNRANGQDEIRDLINLKDKEPISVFDTFEDLKNKRINEGKSFIIARIYLPEGGQTKSSYYDAYALLRSYFGENFFDTINKPTSLYRRDEDGNLLNPKSRRKTKLEDISTRIPIGKNTIEFYKLNNATNNFDYIGNDRDLFVYNKKDLAQIFKDNKPIEKNEPPQ